MTLCVNYKRHVILNAVKDLKSASLCTQILHFVQNDTTIESEYVHKTKIKEDAYFNTPSFLYHIICLFMP